MFVSIQIVILSIQYYVCSQTFVFHPQLIQTLAQSEVRVRMVVLALELFHSAEVDPGEQLETRYPPPRRISSRPGTLNAHQHVLCTLLFNFELKFINGRYLNSLWWEKF